MIRRIIKLITVTVALCLLAHPGLALAGDIEELSDVEKYDMELLSDAEEELILRPDIVEDIEDIEEKPEEAELSLEEDIVSLPEGPEESEELKVYEGSEELKEPEMLTSGGGDRAGSDVIDLVTCELVVVGQPLSSENDYSKCYESNPSANGSATVYTGAVAGYYDIISTVANIKTWESSDTGILKVTKDTINSARLTPVKAGSVTITATATSGYGNAIGKCKITVKTGTTPSSVTPGSTSITVNKGQSKTTSFTWDPTDCTYRDIYLKATSGGDCVTVGYESASKVSFTGKKAGTAKFAYYDGFTNTKRGTITITVLVPVTGVSLNATSATLTPGATKQLTATISPSDATNKTVTYTSGNTSVAIVSSTGLVTAKTPGSAVVTVKTADGAKTATCTVTVNKIAVTSVTLSSTAEAVINVGGTVSRTATAAPSNATYPSITWTSSDTAIASVSGGVVTGKGPGSATITAKADGKSASFKVTVKRPVTGVTLSKSSLTLNLGATSSLTATVSPSDASNKAVTWASSDPTIATVDSNGLVTGVKTGWTNISVTTADGGKKAVCEVVVLPVYVTGVSVSKVEETVMLGHIFSLSAFVHPDNATDKTITWSSEAPDIVYVSSGGLVRGVAVGQARVIVTTNDGHKTAACTVTVIPVPASEVLLNKDEANLVIGQSKTLTATVLPEDTTDKSVTWKSSNTNVVTVTDKGVITGTGIGSAVVTVTTSSDHRRAVCEVIVTGTEVNHTLSYGENDDGSKTVTGTDGDKRGDLVIPGTVKGDDVSAIGNGAFKGDEGFNGKLSLPDGIVIIGEEAFSGCFNLNGTLTLPGTLVSILEEAFKGCAGFSGNLIIPPGVLNIGDGAFANLSGIDGRLVIPDSLLNLGPDAFAGMYSVGEIRNDSDMKIKASSFISANEKDDVCLVDTDGNRIYYRDYIGRGTYRRHYPVKTVELDREEASLEKGKTLKLFARVLPDKATDRTLVWSSTDPDVAYVSGEGTVTGVKEGTVRVRAASTDTGISAYCSIRVYADGAGPKADPTPLPTREPTPSPTRSPSPVPKPSVTPVPAPRINATGIKINKKKVTVKKGKTYQLKATVLPANATDRTVTWKSSDKKTATVDKNGKVKGKKKGTATITAATKNGIRIKCKVTVKDPVRVKSIRLDKKKASIKRGKTLKLKVTFSPKKPDDKGITWKSSDKKIATVDKKGKVKGKKKGTVTITAVSKDGKKKAKCKVTVK